MGSAGIRPRFVPVMPLPSPRITWGSKDIARAAPLAPFKTRCAECKNRHRSMNHCRLELLHCSVDWNRSTSLPTQLASTIPQQPATPVPILPRPKVLQIAQLLPQQLQALQKIAARNMRQKKDAGLNKRNWADERIRRERSNNRR